MANKVLRRIGWTMIAVGSVLAALFVSGLTHPVSAQVPSTVVSYNWHHRWVVAGFVISIVGAAVLLGTVALRRNQEAQEAAPSTTPAD